MAIHIQWTWIDRDGREAPDKEIEGYHVTDYFDEPISQILSDHAREPGAVRARLRAAYRGPDCDGVGLLWEVLS